MERILESRLELPPTRDRVFPCRQQAVMRLLGVEPVEPARRAS